MTMFVVNTKYLGVVSSLISYPLPLYVYGVALWGVMIIVIYFLFVILLITYFHFHLWKVYLILDEFILAGELQETSKKVRTMASIVAFPLLLLFFACLCCFGWDKQERPWFFVFHFRLGDPFPK